MTKTISHLVLTSSISILFSSYALAALQCVTGNESSTSLVTQLESAKKNNKLTQTIYAQYQLGPKTEAECSECNAAAAAAKKTADAAAAAKGLQSAIFSAHEPPHLAFEPQCLITSNKSSSSNAPQISCPSGEKVKSAMCITEEQLQYQNAVISSFVNCAIKSGLTGINLNSIFQKLSIESGFRPQYSSGNGTGIGQVTSIFVEDIHQAHRGKKYLQKIAENNSDACKAARLIAEPDLSKKPAFKDKCEFISTGEGFERNVLYSLIGTTTTWEMNIEPKLRGYLKKNENDSNIEEVKKLAIMNAYGPAGPAGAAAAARRLSSVSPARFVKLMHQPMYGTNGRNLTAYTSQIKKRQDTIAGNLPGSLKEKFAKEGAQACINPL